MNHDYEAFCMANPLFYDTPGKGDEAGDYEIGRRPAPSGWQRDSRHHWIIYSSEAHALPAQGWKIHVAGCLGNAERIIEAVWTYCIPRDISFKFLCGSRAVLARNAKYAGRGGSGKLVTVYPRGEAELELACKELDHALTGEPGPYILSDLRWRSGPLHVRYGGFAPRYCTDDRGMEVLAIEDSLGVLVPDVRGAVFSLPTWVDLPEFLEPHLSVRNATTVVEIPYDIVEALHFSNGGGVYVGVDRRTKMKVVLKEARPHAGLSGDGVDAVTRLRRERDVLERLAGLDAVPQLLDYLTVGEHEFLVMELIEGAPLNTELAQRCPLLEDAVDEVALADYAGWAQSLHGAVEHAIGEIHQRGVVYGDLHLFNVIVRPDGRIALIDFEVADDVHGDGRPALGAVGFTAPRDRLGFDIDRYALACLKLALFVPLERLLGLERAKATHLAAIVAEHFPVPRPWLDQAVDVIAGEPGASPSGHWVLEPSEPGWQRTRASLMQGILASATPDRDDRLFPGDIAQFEAGGLNLAYGAAGVLYALDVTGAGRYPDHEEWLIRRAHEPDDEARIGFYDGLHGIAHVLAHLGHQDEAMTILDRCLSAPWHRGGDDLYGGVSGVGLNLAHLADVTGDPALHEAAQEATQLVADRLGTVDDVAETSGGEHAYAGLLRGSAGRALLFVRMYEHTGEPALLDHAATALRQDLRRCVPRERDGQLHVNEGSRTMPYLAVGSIGIGLVLTRYLAHRSDDELVDAAWAIRGAACSLFYVQPGLFNGRAGMVLYLNDGRPPGVPADVDAALAAQIHRLGWHALTFRGELAFPGDQLLRLSMDLATGSAGVLLALGAALHDQSVHLPFLGSPRPRRAVSQHHATDERTERG